MAYLAMARKWRPKNFEEMVGQDHIAQTIRNAIEGKRIGHAYLFTGTRGVGKTTSARILAKALNCKNGPTPIPCDQCDNCKAVNAGNSMDVLEIDGASNNSVDNIRDLREQVKYAPMHGTYKIYVIDEVHMLSKSAFNALLKTLEEPPPHVVFIFATTEAGKLPHTILSRVQRFDFKRISEGHIRGRLEFICSQEAIHPEREALEAIARKADGSMRDALSLFDQVYAFSGSALTLEAARKVLGLPRESLFDGLLAALILHDQKTCFDSLQEAHQEGIESLDLLVAFGEYLRNVLFSRQGVSPVALGLSENRLAEMKILAPELRDGDIIRYAKMVSDILAQLKNSANPRLTVELGFARMASLDRVVSLSQILAQEFSGTKINSESLSEVKKKNLVELSGELNQEVHHEREREPETEREPKQEQGLEPVAKKSSEHRQDIEPEPESEKDFSPELNEGFARNIGSMVIPNDLAPGNSLNEISDLGDSVEYSDTDPIDLDSIESGPSLSPNHANFQSQTMVAPVILPAQESPAALPELWPELLREFIADRPLLGSHLRQSRLEWKVLGNPGDTVTGELQVWFTDKAAYSLIGEDADYRKSIQAFLGTKLKKKIDFAIKFSLDENSSEKNSNASSLGHFGSGEPMQEDPLKIPIVNYILDLFQGRIVN